MSHAKNKMDWCLKKAERELKEEGKHRGLVRIEPDIEKARKHILKAEHYLKATDYLKKGNFSDISISTIFYAMYHCLLAIAVKFGYNSRNQECTFALMYSLIEDGKLNLDEETLRKISVLDIKNKEEPVTIEKREFYQYETELSIKDGRLYKELFELAQEIISKAKDIIG